MVTPASTIAVTIPTIAVCAYVSNAPVFAPEVDHEEGNVAHAKADDVEDDGDGGELLGGLGDVGDLERAAAARGWFVGKCECLAHHDRVAWEDL